MKITVLTENNPGAFLLAEHGLSYLIQFENKRILFDTGQSDVFIKNAEKMKTSLANIDMIVLSHGHFDHGNGLNYLPGGSLICHSGCFVRRYRKKDHSYIGLLNTKEELSGKFDLDTTTDPLKITEKIFFLGEIPRLTDFESKKTSFVFEDGTPDYVMDDSALAFILPEGLFIVTGCGHAGVVNTFEHARRITGISNLYGIIGGFHLKEIDLQTKETVRYLKENKVKYIFPSHCTELPALSAFYKEFGIRQAKTGDILDF
jgi:7,8-dihydropterin-6-yl-methyl-4-(beta-D-ribofuranosyl)aminobenzene 5'-phosphate synthase